MSRVGLGLCRSRLGRIGSCQVVPVRAESYRVVSGRVGLCYIRTGRTGSCRVVPGRVGLCCIRTGRAGSCRVELGCVVSGSSRIVLYQEGACQVVSRWADPGSRSPDPPESIRIRLGQKGQIFTYVCLY